MDTQSIYTIILAVVGILGSTSAWRFYEKRAMRKEKADEYMKDENRERIAKLEILLEKSALEKDEMRYKILELTKEVTALRVKIEVLEDRNRELSMDLVKNGGQSRRKNTPKKNTNSTQQKKRTK